MIHKTIDIVSWVNINNKLYFKSYRGMPGLFCYDILYKKLELIKEPAEVYRSWEKYGYSTGIGSINKYVVFAPHNAKKFIVLNTESMEILSFDKKRLAVYTASVEYDGKLIIFAKKLSDSVVFDSRSLLFEYPFSSQPSSIETRLVGCVKRKGKRVILSTQHKDCVAEIDLESYCVNIRFLKELDIVYNMVILCGDNYILTGDKPLLVIWDGTAKTETLKLDSSWMRPQTIPWPDLFFGAVIKEEKAFFCPQNYKMLTCFDLTTKKIEYLYEMEEKEHACMNELPEGLLLSIIEEDSPKRNCLYRYDGRAEDCTIFDFKDEFKLSGASIEYSRKALQYFIDDLIL
mgnify:CR=1 FL=1